MRICKSKTSSVSFGLCVVCPSLTYRFWLPLQYLLAFVLSVLLWFTDSDYPFSIFWPRQHKGQKILKGKSESVNQRRTDNPKAKRYWRGNQNRLPLQYLLTFVLSVLLWFTDSDYPFSIFWPLRWQRPKDTEEVIRICKSKKDRQHKGQKILEW
jgi:hypothetical protein